MKIAIIGAGNVGATLAMRIVEKGFADVVMIDIREGIAKAKSLDLSDAAPLVMHESKIYGTEDIKEIKDSNVIVVTAGFPRSPGMTREELLSKNKKIIEDVSSNIKEYAPSAIVIIVTNPLDIMTYISYKKCGFPKNRVFGIAGDLDRARFIELITQKLHVKRGSISTIIMGSHGDTMVPLASHTKVSGKPLSKLIPKEEIDELIEGTKKRGGEIVSLLKESSAYYAPSAAVSSLIETIVKNKRRVHCVSAFLEGEYGLSDICIGVPARIGKNGIEEILKIDLSAEEEKAFRRSAEAIKENLALLKKKQIYA